MEGERQHFRTTNNSHCRFRSQYWYSYLCQVKNQMKQEKLFYYNVKLRRVRITIFAVEYLYVLNIMCVCVCVSLFLPYLSSKYSACAILYGHLLSVCLYHIFPHYPTNGTIFGEEMSTKFVFLFPLQLGLKHFSL